jgi:hypothetical protein
MKILTNLDVMLTNGDYQHTFRIDNLMAGTNFECVNSPNNEQAKDPRVPYIARGSLRGVRAWIDDKPGLTVWASNEWKPSKVVCS